MELNGIANLHAILDITKMEIEEDAADKELILAHIKDMKTQLDTLERYMIHLGQSFKKAAPHNYHKIAKWHEVREDIDAFPKHRDLHEIFSTKS